MIKSENDIIEFVKILKDYECRNPFKDMGFLMMIKEKQLKKKPNMRKFNVVFYGDTILELKKNMYILINEIDSFKGIHEFAQSEKLTKGTNNRKRKKRKYK